jgi:hypothetical protein
VGNGCLKEVSRYFFTVGGEFVGKGITANVCVYDALGVGVFVKCAA